MNLPRWMLPMPRQTQEQNTADAWVEHNTLARVMTDAGYVVTVARFQPSSTASASEIKALTAGMRDEWHKITGG